MLQQEEAGICKLHSLPEELLLKIIWLLEIGNPCPSSESIFRYREPSPRNLFKEDKPLKNLSSTCGLWRRLTFPILFRNLRIEFEAINPQWTMSPDIYEDSAILAKNAKVWMHMPSRGEELYEFAVKNRLKSITKSVVIHSTTAYVFNENLSRDPLDPTTNVRAKELWHHLFLHFQPTKVIIIAPPPTISHLMDSRLGRHDGWAFKIPFQRVQLNSITNREWPMLPPGGGISNGPNWTPTPQKKTLLNRRPFTNLRYTSGSHLNVYGTYHYFEKLPPCFLTPHLSLPIVGQNLTGFTYIAIFPHHAHFTQLIPIISHMQNLRTLTLRLAPDPQESGGVLSDEALVSRGNVSFRDCWSETERCYRSVVQQLVVGTDGITEAGIAEMNQAGPRNAVTIAAMDVFRIVNELPRLRLRKLRVFQSLDYNIASIREELEKQFLEFTESWEFLGTQSFGRWCRRRVEDPDTEALPWPTDA